MKLYNDNPWDDDACNTCGEILVRESRVPGLCEDCWNDSIAPKKPSVQNSNEIPTPTVTVYPPEEDHSN